MILRITEQQAQKVHALVRLLCCNCEDDNCVLLHDGAEHTCVQLISLYGIYCRYFRDAVLPSDEALHTEILKYNNLR